MTSTREPPTEHAAPEAAAAAPRDSPGAIFLRFLRFGALAWGGPAAQIAMIKRECVDELGWVDEGTFTRTLAVYQALPGPEAHELAVFFGRLRGGRIGGLMAGLGFMLPGLLLMLGLAALYVEADLAGRLDAVFYGLKAAVGAIVVRALVRLTPSFVRDVPLALLAVAAFVLTMLAPWAFFPVLLGAGVLYAGWRRGLSLRAGAAPSLAWFGLPAILAVAVALPLTAEIFWAGLKTGLVTFGGAFTAVPYLHGVGVVGERWVTEGQFIDGLAIGAVLPAPFVIFATFVGYVAGGPAGALAITAGVFLPAFVLPIFLHRGLVGVAENPRVRPFLFGVGAAVIGLIAAVAVDILRAGVVDVATALLTLAAFLALLRWHGKLTVLWVVLGCGLVGGALQAAGVV